jgi:hypothetical protein
MPPILSATAPIGCHENDFLFAENEIHASNNAFDDLALANTTFPSKVKEDLVPLGSIIGVVNPR